MRAIKTFTLLLAASVLLSACGGGAGRVGKFWNKTDITVTENNYSEAQDRFAEFAELSVSVSPRQALAALDKLFDKLKSDDVSYYVYSEWLVAAYHSLLSPCRNPDLFAQCAEHFRTDGIMAECDYSPLVELSDKDMLNHEGAEVSLPELLDSDGQPLPSAEGEEALYAVINLDCATCVAALRALADKPGRHIAICFGHTPAPLIEGWEYAYPRDIDNYFDLDAAPFWFTVSADGHVTTPYSMVPETNVFATPDNQ